MVSVGNYDSAVMLIERNKGKYGSRDHLIYLMDLAILNHYSGRYAESTKLFNEADRVFEDKYTESITKYGATFLVNDLTADYRGEDFESVMIPMFSALNYARLGEPAEALVEARRVDNRLNAINSKYAPGKKNVYKEDAFARFLMGIMYETGGTAQDFNDAYISYKKAYEIYTRDFTPNYGTRAPLALKENLLSVAAFMGPGEWARWKESFPGVRYITLEQRRSMAELYVIHYNGRAPVKREESIMVPIPNQVVKVAFPKYVARPYNIRTSIITALCTEDRSGARASSVLAENIGRIAIKNLANRKGRVIGKAMARAAIKAAGVAALSREHEMLGLLANIAAIATEVADLRCWQTLPAEIRIAKLMVRPGSYRVTADCVGAGRGIVQRVDLESYKLEAGQKKFMVFQTFN